MMCKFDPHDPVLNIKKVQKGQTLMEFVMVLPVLILIALGTFYVGSAMFSGQRLATATKTPVLNKFTLAGTFGDATNAAQALVTGYNDGNAFSLNGGAADNISVQNTGNVTAVIIGNKTVDLPGPFPTFNFSSTQGINSSLLRANAARGGGLTKGMNALPNTLGAPGIGVAPADFGFTAIPANAMQFATATCGQAPGGPLDFNTVNTYDPNTGYMLTAFPTPDTSAGPYTANYSLNQYYFNDGDIYSTFNNATHPACDNSTFAADCNAAAAAAGNAAGAAALAGNYNGTTAIAAQAAQITANYATELDANGGDAVAAHTAVYDAAYADALAATGDPVQSATMATQVADAAQADYTANYAGAANPLAAATQAATDAAAADAAALGAAQTAAGNAQAAAAAAVAAECPAKSKAACKFQYGARYMDALMQDVFAMGACNENDVSASPGVVFNNALQPY